MTCQPATVSGAAHEQMFSGLSAQRGSCTWAGRAEVTWGSEASALPRDSQARPGPDSSLSYQLQPSREGQSHLLDPFQVSPSLIFLGKKDHGF